MIDQHEISVILTAAMPPAPLEPAPVPARTIKDAIRNLEREADLLLIEARQCHPFHETLHEMTERIAR